MPSAVCTRACGLGVLLLLLHGCVEEKWRKDRGIVCVSVAGSASNYRLAVKAEGPNCTGDHEGAEIECEVKVSGAEAKVSTRFRDGEDPDDGCFGRVRATCGASIPEGVATVSFRGGQAEIAVPGGAEVCLPEGADGTDSGW